jgi:lipid-A-disaccharide synthase
VDADFVGHPLAELPHPHIDREDYARRYKLDPEKHWITLMPGSRVKEVRMNLPDILKSAAQFGRAYEFLLPIASTLDPRLFQSLRTSDTITLVYEALPALWHSRAGIIASGTATVEAGMMCTPFVMVYRVSSVTYALGRWRIKVPHFAMVNLIAGEEIVPELVQDDFTPANVVARLHEIIPDGAAREKMIEGLTRVKARLRSPAQGEDPRHPAERAADAILRVLGAPADRA